MSWKLGVLAALACALVVALVWLVLAGRMRREPPSAALLFSREGLSGEIVRAVERVAQPGGAQVAVQSHGDARWVCIVVDAPGRHFDLDTGWRPEDFPMFAQRGLQPPPPQLLRTMSIYRSVAKGPMKYRDGADRIIILLCPKDEWPQLSLAWPNR